MKNIMKFVSIAFVMFFLTGCVQPLYTEDNKPVLVESTGQQLTQNIVCQPSNTEIFELYKENGVKVDKLPTCESMKFSSGLESGVWDGIFVVPLAKLIVIIGSIVRNYGLAIIIATILIRLAIWPLTKNATEQTKKMSEMQPEMKRIQDKYANKTDQDSKMKMNQEVMGLYSKYNVNPLMGCITPFLQLPILLAFYEAIYRTPAIFEGHFLGLELGLTPSTALNNGQPFYLILVVLNVLTTYISSKMSFSTNQQAAQQMKFMLYFMPLMIGWFAFTLPTALSIYWILSNLISMFQTYVTLRKKDDK